MQWTNFLGGRCEDALFNKGSGANWASRRQEQPRDAQTWTWLLETDFLKYTHLELPDYTLGLLKAYCNVYFKEYKSVKI